MSANSIKPDPELGLCLAGGGALGFIHIGLFRTLEELGIKPGIIAGCSSGSILGAFYAKGFKSDEIEEMLEEFHWLRVLAATGLRRGLLSTKRMQRFFKKKLGDIRIEDLDIKLKIAAMDLQDGTLVGFTEGPLAKCLAAGAVVAGVFEPVRIGGHLYYDAGGVYNLPLELLANEGIKTIIAANTIGQFGLMRNPRSVREVLYQAYLIRTMHLVAARTGPQGWQGKVDEEVILIDYHTHGSNPTMISECAAMIEDAYVQSMEILGDRFGK